MKKILLFSLLFAWARIASSQIIGYLVSVNPNTAMQGQSLTTTITEPPGSFIVASPPCNNLDVYIIQGGYKITSTYINIVWQDQIDADFSIPAAAPIGYYDVYVGSGYYDWWSGNCTNQGWWVLYNGFEVTGSTGINNHENSEMHPSVNLNVLTGSATISFNNPDAKKFNISIIDSHGRIVCTTSLNTDHCEFNRKDLESGIYYYRIEGVENQTSFSGKFILPE